MTKQRMTKGERMFHDTIWFLIKGARSLDRKPTDFVSASVLAEFARLNASKTY